MKIENEFTEELTVDEILGRYRKRAETDFKEVRDLTVTMSLMFKLKSDYHIERLVVNYMPQLEKAVQELKESLNNLDDIITLTATTPVD